MPFGQCPGVQAVADESIHQRAAVHAVRNEHEPLLFEVLDYCEQPVLAVPCVGCGRRELVAADDLVGRRCSRPTKNTH